MWRVIDMRNPGDLFDMPYSLEIMCRHAVDRSQGQLIDINIEYFGTDELMDYISRRNFIRVLVSTRPSDAFFLRNHLSDLTLTSLNRSSHLRRLTLVDSISISGENLIGALKRFPELEELSLTMMEDVLPQNMEAIGKCYPLLKSFTSIGRACRHEPSILMDEIDDNECAAGVAKGIPNLHHLALIADDMKNEGLQAVLDGCPHLESLDIRQCFGVDLKGALGERCSKQIKHLRLPNEPTSDIGWMIGAALLEYFESVNSYYRDHFVSCGEDYLDSPNSYYGDYFVSYGEDYLESPNYYW